MLQRADFDCPDFAEIDISVVGFGNTAAEYGTAVPDLDTAAADLDAVADFGTVAGLVTAEADLGTAAVGLGAGFV